MTCINMRPLRPASKIQLEEKLWNKKKYYFLEDIFGFKGVEKGCVWFDIDLEGKFTFEKDIRFIAFIIFFENSERI